MKNLPALVGDVRGICNGMASAFSSVSLRRKMGDGHGATTDTVSH